MEKGFHISLRGGAHKQNGKPMQDFSSAVRGDGFDIAIVCDGHGSDKHFRSHVGSRLATEVVEEKFIEFAKAYPTYEDASKDFKRKSERLRLSIVAAWMKKIDKDCIDNPFTEDELKCGVDPGVDYFSRYTKLVPYGTTVLAVLLSTNYYLALMIGDGAIIRMTPNGDAVEEAFEGKKLGDRVESMCNQDAAFKIYTKCVKIEEDEKDMAFALCSDGYCESEAFKTRESMCNWPKKYINVIAKYTLEEARTGISGQLAQISDVSMAQDDISIAIAVKDPKAYLIKAPAPKAEEENTEEEKAEEEKAEEDTENESMDNVDEASGNEEATESVEEAPSVAVEKAPADDMDESLTEIVDEPSIESDDKNVSKAENGDA